MAFLFFKISEHINYDKSANTFNLDFKLFAIHFSLRLNIYVDLNYEFQDANKNENPFHEIPFKILW